MFLATTILFSQPYPQSCIKFSRRTRLLVWEYASRPYVQESEHKPPHCRVLSQTHLGAAPPFGLRETGRFVFCVKFSSEARIAHHTTRRRHPIWMGSSKEKKSNKGKIILTPDIKVDIWAFMKLIVIDS